MKYLVGRVRSNAGRMAPRAGTAEGAREKSFQMWPSGISSAIWRWYAAWRFLIRASFTRLDGPKVRSASGRWMGVSWGRGTEASLDWYIYKWTMFGTMYVSKVRDSRGESCRVKIISDHHVPSLMCHRDQWKV